MKIIGTAVGGFIVTASETELANIMGFDYPSSIPDKQGRPTVGNEIPVSGLWHALQHSRARRGEIADLAKRLRATADKVDGINASLEHPLVEVKP